MDPAREHVRPQAPATISWKRFLSHDARGVVPGLIMAIIFVAFLRLVAWVEVLERHQPIPFDMAIFDGIVLAMTFAINAFYYRGIEETMETSATVSILIGGSAWGERWPGFQLARDLMKPRSAIAAAPRSPTFALCEGQVACPAHGTPRGAPITGRASLYYRVLIEQWGPHRPWRNPWTILNDEQWLGPLIVSDDSGFMLVERSDETEVSEYLVPKKLRFFARATEYVSRTGVRGLPQEARAYIEATAGALTRLDETKLLRVTELVIQEGDVITLVGAVKTKPAPSGPFRPEAGATILEMEHFIDLVPASLADLRRIISVQRWITTALVVAALLGLGYAGFGIFRMAAR